MSFLRLIGVAALRKAMLDAIAAARDPGEWWVGSAVVYGPFQEFGTMRLPARPHWRPEIAKLQREFQGTPKAKQNDFVNVMITVPRGLVKLVAFRLERSVKISIRRQGIIDLGNYVGSVATGPSEGEAFSVSAAQSDPNTVARG